MSITQALGGLTQIPQWFVWRLTWDAAKGKYDKTPCTPHGPWIIDASKPENWHPYPVACAVLDQMRTTQGGDYALGFWLTAQCGYWFLDADKCVINGQVNEIASYLLGQLPGVFLEYSSSGNGLHFIGRGTVPTHRMRNKQFALELYTDQRGIAFGTTGQAWGNADVGSAAIADLAGFYFPPRVAGEAGDFDRPRADWRGPADDAALLERMLAAESTASKLGHRASFRQLWYNMPELERFYGPDSGSERDAALAQHLAFWTGCDAPRMERLMRSSLLYRAKWDEHRTYLVDLTICGACERQQDVYREPERVDPATHYQWVQQATPSPAATGTPSFALAPLPPAVVTVHAASMVTPEARATIDALLEMVHGATSWDQVHNEVIPAIRSAGVPSMLMSRIENAVNKRLDLWDAKLPIAKLRALLAPPVVNSSPDETASTDAPDWLKPFAYCREGDKFHNTETGVSQSRTSFNAEHNRLMPLKDNGLREDAVMWALERWSVPIVHNTMYWPGKPGVFEVDGLKWANIYTEASHPPVEEYTAQGVAAIDRFCRHLQILVDNRKDVYELLLAFMAHNVQHPGVKIRYCPVIKGTEGDGKSMIGAVMSAAMGARNVAFVGPDLIANSGGFTDWAHGHALVALEELYMAGKERHRISNAVKPYVSNDRVSINPKGDKPKQVYNTCNQIAYTNKTDAIPIESGGGRRWLVIFTQFNEIMDLVKACGFNNKRELESHFDVIFDSLKREPGQWRRWLLSYRWQDVELFSINSLRVETVEKQQMVEAGMDDVESLARAVINEGGHGVSTTVLSSSMFSLLMKTKAYGESVEIPKNHSWHHILNRMGFVKVVAPMWWNGKTHRVWAKMGVAHSTDILRGLLDATRKG